MKISALFLQGCAEKLEEEEAVSTEETADAATTSIDISVSFPADQLGRMMTATGSIEDIVSVRLQVHLESDGSVLLPEVELTETHEGSGTWKGTISDLPVFKSLIFVASAYNERGQAIYSDTVTRELSDGASTGVILEMEAVDDDEDPENPRIVSLTVPNEIQVGSVNNPIVFNIRHRSPVQYTLSAERGTIASPVEGELDPIFDLEIGYDAPETAGSDTIRISIHDPEMTDTISTEYAITIVERQADAGITIIFGPAITAMHFLRTDNSLQVSSETVPAAGLLYEWSGSGSFDVFTSNQNPVIISNFSDDDSGIIELTVTGENGIQTSISRTISPGDFPYLVLVSDEPNPVDTVLDIATLLLWQDDTSHPFLPHADAADYCRNTFETGGFADWRLPTRAELKGLYLRRNILNSALPYSYWASELSSRDQSRAWYRAFGWGYESIKRRTYYSCVRNWQQ